MGEKPMMDSDALRIKVELDKALVGVGPNIAVLFGEKLFREFRNRGWITIEKFGAFGTTLLEQKVPAYGRTHFAIFTWDVPDTEFRVGKNA